MSLLIGDDLLMLVPEKKKSDFSIDISPKNRFSACMEKIFAKENRKSKNWRKIGKIADFWPKNRKMPIFPPKIGDFFGIFSRKKRDDSDPQIVSCF